MRTFLTSLMRLGRQVRAMLINSARTLGGIVDTYVPAARPPCRADTGVCPAWVQVPEHARQIRDSVEIKRKICKFHGGLRLNDCVYERVLDCHDFAPVSAYFVRSLTHTSFAPGVQPPPTVVKQRLVNSPNPYEGFGMPLLSRFCL
jgi:hypothetical protein